MKKNCYAHSETLGCRLENYDGKCECEVSTKLPAGLEKLKLEKSEEYAKAWAKRQITFYNQETLIMREHFEPGFDAGALEVLQRAEKLAEALKSIKCDTKELGTAEECIDALSNWQAWKESK